MRTAVHKAGRLTRVQLSHEKLRAAAEAKLRRASTWKAIGPQTAKALATVDLFTEPDLTLGGTSPKFIVSDPSGNQYLAKPVDEKSLNFHRERVLEELFRAAKVPHLPVVRRLVSDGRGGEFDVYLKPMVKTEGTLSRRPEEWSDAQRADVLAAHPWIHFIGEGDAHVEQYISVSGFDDGGPKTALCVDWDHALSYLPGDRGVSRFELDGLAIPARRLLYRGYVNGAYDLDFAPLFDAVARIEKLPEAALRRALDPFVTAVFSRPDAVLGRFKTPEELTQALLECQRSLGARFRRFVAEVQTERETKQARGQVPHTFGQAAADVGDWFSRVAYEVKSAPWVAPVIAWRRRWLGLQGEPAPVTPSRPAHSSANTEG